MKDDDLTTLEFLGFVLCINAPALVVFLYVIMKGN